MDFAEYSNYDGLGLAELVTKKEIEPAELVEAAIERIERHNPQLNAVVFKAYDEASAMATTDLSGPFAGVPMLLKDILGFSVLQRRNERRGRRCRKAAWKMRAGPSGSAFRSGSQTTPSCFGPMAEVVSVGAKARGTTSSRCASERRTKVNPSMTRR